MEDVQEIPRSRGTGDVVSTTHQSMDGCSEVEVTAEVAVEGESRLRGLDPSLALRRILLLSSENGTLQRHHLSAWSTYARVGKIPSGGMVELLDDQSPAEVSKSIDLLPRDLKWELGTRLSISVM